jgi:hypothetical protein
MYSRLILDDAHTFLLFSYMALAPTPPSYHSIFLNLPDFYLSLSSLCVEMHLPIHTDMGERRDGTMEDDDKNWWVPSNIFLLRVEKSPIFVTFLLITLSLF